MTTHEIELTEEALAADIKRDDALRDSVRAELRAQPFRLAAMYTADFLSTLVRTAAELLVVEAAVAVWVWLLAPSSIVAQFLQSSNMDSTRMLAGFLFFTTGFMVFILRATSGALSKTYRDVVSETFEKRRSRVRNVELVEAVLKGHGLIPPEA